MATSTYSYEYTDTFGGEANYTWVKRGKVKVPELTRYQYDGMYGYAKAHKTRCREIMRKVKAELGLTGVKGKTSIASGIIEFRPYCIASVLFIHFEG